MQIRKIKKIFSLNRNLIFKIIIKMMTSQNTMLQLKGYSIVIINLLNITTRSERADWISNKLKIEEKYSSGILLTMT